MADQLCLKWNNHATAFTQLLRNIYLKDDDGYSDASILCHGKFYPVHRFVLSTCSDYFKGLFNQCNQLQNQHPVIIVQDIHPQQVEALLNYMYKGEVNVAQDDLAELIKAAEALKIKGLAISEDNDFFMNKKRLNVEDILPPITKKFKYDEITAAAALPTIDKICSSDSLTEPMPYSESLSDFVEVKEEPNALTNLSMESTDAEDTCADFVKQEMDIESFERETSVNPLEIQDQFPNIQEGISSSGAMTENEIQDPCARICPFDGCSFSAEYHSIMKRHLRVHTGEKPYQCDKCLFTTARRDVLNNHLKAHAGEKPFQCNECSFTTSFSSALYRHRKTHTGVKPFQCPHCPYTCARRDNLKSHLRSHNMISAEAIKIENKEV